MSNYIGIDKNGYNGNEHSWKYTSDRLYVYVLPEAKALDSRRERTLELGHRTKCSCIYKLHKRGSTVVNQKEL